MINVDGIKYLEEGDIIELDGQKFYMKYYDGKPCGFCALNRILCDKYFSPRNEKYDCAKNCVYAVTAEKIIEREKEKIKESEELIRRLSE